LQKSEVILIGRSIPSISHRLDSKIRDWQRFAKLLNAKEREAFNELISSIKNKRTAIDAADEADLGIAILLAMIVNLKGELNEKPKERDSRS
jgi:hypothetical protein